MKIRGIWSIRSLAYAYIIQLPDGRYGTIPVTMQHINEDTISLLPEGYKLPRGSGVVPVPAYMLPIYGLELDGAGTLRSIRESTGLSQAKFSTALGIPKRSIENWEAGDRECPDYLIDLIRFRVEHDSQFGEA